ncbi:hypothetical protein H8356DRAFT_979811 [Neocallimastix lanati (nom. inval.)]|jgi:nuclear pore complex protein Nup54|nr:hypothetical protein H8356DRAFT_979811 [Neocallimastix sp. JGI-2020a]
MFNSNKRQQTGFGTNQSTGFSFGQTNQTNSNTGFGFGQNNNVTTPGTTTGFGFGQNNQNNNSGTGFNFGNKTNTTGTGLFGSNNNNNNTGTGLFGANNNNNNNNNNSLFKPNTNTGTGLFGSSNNNTGSSLFGNNNNTGGSLFGSNTNTTGGLFGSNNNVSGGLFGNNNAKTGLFGSNTTTGFGGMSQQQQFMGIQQAQQHTSTVADELRKIQEYWNPQSPNCQFKHYFYNMVHPSDVSRYVKPPNDDEGLWRQAQKNNPDSSCMVPALAIGFDGIKKRMAEQSKQTNAHEAKLKELSDKVEKLRQKHLLETTGKLEEYRRRHLNLAHRTLKIMKQVYILKNRGYSIRPEEETLKVRLENLSTSLRKSSQFRGRIEELWAHLQMIRDHPGTSWYNLASTSSNINNNNNTTLNGNISNNINKLSSTGKGNSNLTTMNNNSNLGSSGTNINNGEINSQPGRYVIDEEGLQTIHKILTEHQHGLSILTDYVKKNSKEIEDMYRGYHEPGPHYQNIQQNYLDQLYPTTSLSSTTSVTPLK